MVRSKYPSYTNTNINNGANTQDLELYDFAFQYAPDINATYQQMLDFYNTVTLPGNFTFNSALSNQEHLERQSIEDVNFGETEVYNLVGFNERTIGVVNYWKQINFLRGKFFEKWNLTGDGTVPLRSAEIVTLTKRKADYYIKNEKHEKLPSSEAGIEIIRGLLKEPAETLFAMPDKIYYDPPESYALSVWQAFVSSPVSLHAYDTQGNHTGSITDTSWEANIPNSEYFHGDLRDPHSPKGVLLSPDEDYSLEIISLDTTSSFDLVIDKIINGYSMATVYFDSVVILNQTTAICSLNTSTQIIELEIDFDGDGIIDTVIAPIILTNVENENNSSLLPKDYMLSQNYPNPFNPTTKITYALPKSSLVQIKIFNLLGQEIATLVNEEKSAGFYEMDFNASDLPSGVYLYKLQAGDFVQTKKMILLK